MLPTAASHSTRTQQVTHDTLLLNLDVPDIAAAERFYTASFGLRVARRFGADAVELRGWAAPLYLLRKPEGTIGAAADARTYSRHWTPLHIDVAVDNLDVSLARAASAGAIIEQPAVRKGYGRIAMLADPFGHGFCLIEFSASGYDAISAS